MSYWIPNAIRSYSDSWEWADDPNYPEAWAGQGFRIGINYVIYSMTH